jgi:hypothetical protein
MGCTTRSTSSFNGYLIRMDPKNLSPRL